MEFTNYVAQAFPRSGSPLTMTAVTTSAEGPFTIIDSNSENTPEWNECLVCALHSLGAVLSAINFQLRSPIKTETLDLFQQSGKSEP